MHLLMELSRAFYRLRQHCWDDLGILYWDKFLVSDIKIEILLHLELIIITIIFSERFSSLHKRVSCKSEGKVTCKYVRCNSNVSSDISLNLRSRACHFRCLCCHLSGPRCCPGHPLGKPKLPWGGHGRRSGPTAVCPWAELDHSPPRAWPAASRSSTHQRADCIDPSASSQDTDSKINVD